MPESPRSRAPCPRWRAPSRPPRSNLDLAQTTFKRIQDLAEKKSVSSQEFDEASARLKAAQAAYQMAVSRRAQVQSRIEQAVAGQRSARIMRDYAQIAAPFAGVVTARSVEPGALASPGVPLLTIEREGSYRLEASVEESRLGIGARRTECRAWRSKDAALRSAFRKSFRPWTRPRVPTSSRWS